VCFHDYHISCPVLRKKLSQGPLAWLHTSFSEVGKHCVLNETVIRSHAWVSLSEFSGLLKYIPQTTKMASPPPESIVHLTYGFEAALSADLSGTPLFTSPRPANFTYGELRPRFTATQNIAGGVEHSATHKIDSNERKDILFSRL